MAVTITFIEPLFISAPPVRSMRTFRAISEAAAHIDAHPELYNYKETDMRRPHKCMLGRIGACYGGNFANADGVAPPVLGMGPAEFFQEIGRLILGRIPNFNRTPDYQALHEPKRVAPALRQFAEAYRPREIGLPACVTDLFKEPAHV